MNDDLDARIHKHRLAAAANLVSEAMNAAHVYLRAEYAGITSDEHWQAVLPLTAMIVDAYNAQHNAGVVREVVDALNAVSHNLYDPMKPSF